MKRIIRNAARCKLCGDILESKRVHGLVECGRGAIAIEGGRRRLRRSGDILAIEELSETVKITDGVPPDEENR